jgi:hypothetical protein
VIGVGAKVRVLYDIKGSASVSESTYTMVEHEGALHAAEDHPDGEPSAYPYDPRTGYEIGNPLAAMGIRSRVVLRDGHS